MLVPFAARGRVRVGVFGLASVAGMLACSVHQHSINEQSDHDAAVADGAAPQDAGADDSTPPNDGSGASDASGGNAGSSASGAAGSGGATADAGDASGTAGAGGASGSDAGGAGTGGTTGSDAGGASGSDAGAGGAGGTGPLSGIMVNIGGTMVAKENAVAFLNFGHSNMAGRGVDPQATRPYFFGAPDPHGWMYHSGAGFQPAVEPMTAGDSGNMVNGMVSGGPGTALVKEAVALAPDKYFISVGFAQGTGRCSQFLPTGPYYASVMAGAMEIKDKVTWAGIMIYLGITERYGAQVDVQNYPQCISMLVTSIRKDLGQPNLPMIINDYEMGTTGPLAPGPTNAFYNSIRPKILMVPQVVPNSILIPTDNPLIPIQDDTSTTDDHSFNLDGQKEYVRRMLAAMQGKGWFPWQ
jgi:hypothetical protein